MRKCWRIHLSFSVANGCCAQAMWQDAVLGSLSLSLFLALHFLLSFLLYLDASNVRTLLCSRTCIALLVWCIVNDKISCSHEAWVCRNLCVRVCVWMLKTVDEDTHRQMSNDILIFPISYSLFYCCPCLLFLIFFLLVLVPLLLLYRCGIVVVPRVQNIFVIDAVTFIQTNFVYTHKITHTHARTHSH